MTKSGSKHFTSLSNAVHDLQKNPSVDSLLPTSDTFLASLEGYRDALLNEPVEGGSGEQSGEWSDAKALEDLQASFGQYEAQMGKHQKSGNKSIRTLSTKVDKSVEWELDMVYQYQNINDDFELMKNAIGMDLLYQGKFSEAKTLVGDSPDVEQLVSHFEELEKMIQHIYDENYTVVYEWILAHREIVEKVSEIIPLLNQLVYIQALEIKSNPGSRARNNDNLLLKVLNESDRNVLLKIKDYGLDMQYKNSLGAAIFDYKLPELGSFDKGKTKDEAARELARLYNILDEKVVNLQTESPLNKCLLAGHFSLGVLLKYHSISRRKSSSTGFSAGSNLSGSGESGRRKSRTVSMNTTRPLLDRIRSLHTNSDSSAEGAGLRDGFDSGTYRDAGNKGISNGGRDEVFDESNQVNELAVEIELPRWMGYHTTFICPVLKEETTKKNPPYILLCHHFISKQALSKLTQGLSNEIKCPYCPRRTQWRDAYEVKFVEM